MKTKLKRLFAVVLVLSIVCGGISLPTAKKVYAKTVSKVTRVFTLTPQRWRVKHKLSISENEKVKVKIKFLEVKGKADGTVAESDRLWFGNYYTNDGTSSFFLDSTKPKLRKSDFKKGVVLTSNDYIYGYDGFDVYWDIPNGLKKLKVQVTYYTESGKAGIHSIKTTAVKVKNPKKIKLNVTNKTLYVGEKTNLKVKKVIPAKASTSVTWKSSNEKVATVTAKGKVTAKKEGTAKITAISKKNQKVKAVCEITVKEKKEILEEEIYSGSYENITWTINKGLLEVKGTGEMDPSDENRYGYKNIVIKSQVQK